MLFYLTFECIVSLYIINLKRLIITFILSYSIGYITPPICTLPIKTYYKWNIHCSNPVHGEGLDKIRLMLIYYILYFVLYESKIDSINFSNFICYFFSVLSFSCNSNPCKLGYNTWFSISPGMRLLMWL